MLRLKVAQLAMIALVLGSACGDDDGAKKDKLTNPDDGDGAVDGNAGTDDESADGEDSETVDGEDADGVGLPDDESSEDEEADGTGLPDDESDDEEDAIDPRVAAVITATCAQQVMCWPDDQTAKECGIEARNEWSELLGEASATCQDAMLTYSECSAELSCKELEEQAELGSAPDTCGLENVLDKCPELGEGEGEAEDEGEAEGEASSRG